VCVHREFNAEVVALVRQGERSLPTICREMDLSETAVRRWVEQAAVDAGAQDGLTTEAREELRRLRRENRSRLGRSAVEGWKRFSGLVKSSLSDWHSRCCLSRQRENR
jgi:transposase-like protein